ncbi:hypothetical protein LTR56_015335 [Elasticomyces elasticus]|nr:hypothetical protein LTR22_027345 [Elasticomyces elasticus]KAK3634301.1 hypothetical protein LTR56_015335 [Elasticomyces elasticus]KAK4897903.1 hypothetical protein LTR49_027901 [Elasticomyces elasticus]KAK5746132.1 hypothetical protein LTS12_022845 [Elasticomyces elasticus]
MKHAHGVHVQLRDIANNNIAAYEHTPAVAPTAVRGQYEKCYIEERPSDPFQVKIWFDEDFNLHGANGVAFVITCGHEHNAGSQQRQCFWLKPEDINTPTWEWSHKMWQADAEAELQDRYFTFPVLKSGVERSAPETHEVDLVAQQGSIVVSVLRGHWPVGPNGLPSIRSSSLAAARSDDVRPPHLTTDPPDLTQARWNGEPPIAIARHWLDQLEGESGQPYVFEFKNVDVSEVVREGMKLLVDTDELAAGLLDRKQVSDGEYNPVDGRKRKRGTATKASTRKQRQPGSDECCGIGSTGWRARLNDEDQDDEEILPVKTEACDNENDQREDRHAAESLGRLSLEPKAEAVSRAGTPAGEPQPTTQAAPGTPEEEDLYNDSRHPSLYRQLNDAEAGTVVQGALQQLATHPLNHISGEHHGSVDGDSAADGQVSTEAQGNLPGHIDLTMADAEEGVLVKQEADDTGDNVATAGPSRANWDGSEDEEDLEIRAEGLRLQREDVRIQREQLEVRKRQHAMQKKKREGN